MRRRPTTTSGITYSFHPAVRTMPRKPEDRRPILRIPARPLVSPLVRPMPSVSPFVRPNPFVRPLVRPRPFVRPFVRPRPFVNPLVRPMPFVSPFVRPIPLVSPFVRPRLRLLRAQPALPGSVRLAEARVEFRLEDPKAWVRRIELREPIEGLQGPARIVEGGLGGRHREQGVRVLGVQLQALAGDLHDEGEPPGPLLLGLEDAPFRGDHRGRTALGGLAHHLHPGLRHLEDPERWVRSRVPQMEDSDLPEDPVPATGTFDLDISVY